MESNDRGNPAVNGMGKPSQSDRERRGLRGPVKVCVEETIHQGESDSQHQEWRSWAKLQFSPEGMLTAESIRNQDDSEWTKTYTYDSLGLLLKIVSNKDGKMSSETVNRYDHLGRIQSTTCTEYPPASAAFTYDQAGRKTKVQISGPEDYIPNCSAGGSPFASADRAPNLPDGGNATTSYDNLDRPYEVQVRDAHGELISRAVRIYDEWGRIVEEKQTLQNPTAFFPLDSVAKTLEKSGATIDDLRGQISNAMAGITRSYSVNYQYDPQGRISKTIRRFFNREDSTDFKYNESGDIESEVTQGSEMIEKGATEPTRSETIYSYKYDHYRNWTEKIVSHRHLPDGVFASSVEILRTLTYY